MISLSTPLTPRDPNGTPFVVVIGRISSPHQNIENINASYEDAMKYVRGIYDGEMEIRYLGEQGSGMLVDRETIRQAEELIASGKVDLVVAEDLSRIYRNPRMQYAFVQDCVDAGVRVICPGDTLDTADENWEVTLGATTLRHGLFIPDLRRRIRRTATHTFHMAKAIANGGQLEALVSQLASTEQRIKEIAGSLEQAEVRKADAFASYELVAANADAALRVLVAESYEFADVMREFFPQFMIQLVQALDTGLVRPRGKLRFQSAADDSNEHGAPWLPARWRYALVA